MARHSEQVEAGRRHRPSVLNAIRGGNGETKNHLLTLVCALVRANLIASTPRSLAVLCRRGEAGENDEGKSGARCLSLIYYYYVGTGEGRGETTRQMRRVNNNNNKRIRNHQRRAGAGCASATQRESHEGMWAASHGMASRVYSKPEGRQQNRLVDNKQGTQEQRQSGGRHAGMSRERAKQCETHPSSRAMESHSAPPTPRT